MWSLKHLTLVGALLALPAGALAGRSDLSVPPSDTFLLGGDQTAPMMVRGQNIGATSVVILARRDATETQITVVAPGARFVHRYAVGETALIRNPSATPAARLSVDFTGSPAALSMRYAQPRDVDDARRAR